ncbi:SepL/TyeA/HrpJ family type III secretion system gatekeeper, partial [Acinetobacter baumannii]
GLNIAMALQAASDDPQERQAVRALYYASVVVRQSLASMMQSLLGVYGGEQFATGLKVMRRALADDIAACTSSVPTAQLRTLLQGLQSCGQLSGVLCN